MFFFSVYAWPVWIVADVSNSFCTLTDFFFPHLESYTSFFLQKGLLHLVTPDTLAEQEERRKRELHNFFIGIEMLFSYVIFSLAISGSEKARICTTLSSGRPRPKLQVYAKAEREGLCGETCIYSANPLCRKLLYTLSGKPITFWQGQVSPPVLWGSAGGKFVYILLEKLQKTMVLSTVLNGVGSCEVNKCNDVYFPWRMCWELWRGVV